MSAETRIEKTRSSSLISSGEREMIKLIRFISTNFQDERVMLMKKRFDKTSNQSSLILDKPREEINLKDFLAFPSSSCSGLISFYKHISNGDTVGTVQQTVPRLWVSRWIDLLHCSGDESFNLSTRWLMNISCIFSSGSFINVFLKNKDVSNDVDIIVWRPVWN